MSRRRGSSSRGVSEPLISEEKRDVSDDDNKERYRGIDDYLRRSRRTPFAWLVLFVMMLYACWVVFQYQYESLPEPLTADQAGKRGFSEIEAIKHVKALTDFGPHPVGSEALDSAMEYVLAAAQEIKKTAHWEVDVEVDFFHAESGANRLSSGLFLGKTLVYSDIKHIIVMILPKFAPEAGENSILVSSHIDTVFSTEGAGDCSSCVGVMLELARGISQWAHGLKRSVIFLFNTGEEEGLNGAHSFITQHPWSKTVRLAIDLEAMGIGGKSSIFQAGPNPWAIENYATAAKYPSGQIVAQDLFSSGVIKSATDFQIYKEVAGLSGLDFAYADNTAVYHTKNDKLDFLKRGSLQHLGENMLPFLLRIGASSDFPEDKGVEGKKMDNDTAIYFDILGSYMVVYRHSLSKMLHYSVIVQSLLIWGTSTFMGGYPAAASLVMSSFSVILMWAFALIFSFAVAFVLPFLSSSPIPYVSSPWLTIGLFGAPSLLGALTGQHLGYLLLQTDMLNLYQDRKKLSPAVQADLMKLEAERWLYKSGTFQWLVLLILGTYYKIGSSYLALVWLIPPAFAYGFLEATLAPSRLPKPLKPATLLIGLITPILLSGGIFIQLAATVIGMLVRFDRNPGGTPEWLGNVVVAAFIAAVVCLTCVYLLSYIHLSGAKKLVVMGALLLFGLSVSAVVLNVVPPFTEDISRAVNVVHVVDKTGSFGEAKQPSSYLSFFSLTPGKLNKEVDHIMEGFVCGRDEVDFVSFSVKYGCKTYNDTEIGWSESDIPTLHVDSDNKGDQRVTEVSINTKTSTRWVLAINTEVIEDFEFTDAGNSEPLIPLGSKSSVEGWHTIQFSGGKNAPTHFYLILQWKKGSTRKIQKGEGLHKDQRPLLKLRTDVDRLTPISERILSKLPNWCSLFGKSTSPYTLAFLVNLPVESCN